MLHTEDGSTAVMGILNLTNDSFSDGGRWMDTDVAIKRAREMIEQGADMIDVGAESTRPGAEPVDPVTQVSRLLPVISAVSNEVAVSVDTRSSEVAFAAVSAGAVMVNDVSGGVYDPRMCGVVAGLGCEMVIMHMRGTPADMTMHTEYDEVVPDVVAELSARIENALEAGIPNENLWVDPGLGFAKTAEQSIELLACVDELRTLDLPILIGASRKRFIGETTGVEVPSQRLAGSLACVAWCALNDVEMVRVHDVAATVRVIEMIRAIKDAS